MLSPSTRRMTDLVAALHWVHENIENFGGDPDRVMIYGQSGDVEMDGARSIELAIQVLNELPNCRDPSSFRSTGDYRSLFAHVLFRVAGVQP